MHGRTIANVNVNATGSKNIKDVERGMCGSSCVQVRV